MAITLSPAVKSQMRRVRGMHFIGIGGVGIEICVVRRFIVKCVIVIGVIGNSIAI